MKSILFAGVFGFVFMAFAEPVPEPISLSPTSLSTANACNVQDQMSGTEYGTAINVEAWTQIVSSEWVSVIFRGDEYIAKKSQSNPAVLELAVPGDVGSPGEPTVPMVVKIISCPPLH